MIEPLRGPIRGQAFPPGSKSYTNRALILAALAEGKSTLTGALYRDDTPHRAKAPEALGLPAGFAEAGKTSEDPAARGRGARDAAHGVEAA